MRFTLTIDVDNAAFTDDPGELSRILHAVADRPEIRSGLYVDGANVRDVNGNRVGSWMFAPGEEES